MPNLNGKIYLAMIIMGCIALVLSGCGSQRASDIEPIEAEPQSVAATVTPTPATEITESESPTESAAPAKSEAPVSPISPILPTKEADSMAAKPIQGSEKALAAAIADLAAQTDVPADEIMLVSMEAVEWSDSSLGCPQEGFMYAQVITPGYLIKLEAAGEPFEYHTDLEGNSVVLCNEQ